MPIGQASILIVDDEPEVCELIRDGLRLRGFHCLTCTEPRQAKQMLDADHYDVLIADVAMPQVSGLDLLTYARQSVARCKVILLTGLSNTRCLAEALTRGAYDYFQKPFDIERLADSVAAAAADERDSLQLPLRAAQAMRHEDQVRQTPIESIRALVHAVEAKDPNTRRHSENVAHYATGLATFVAVPADQIGTIRTAAILHDVGKIGVPDHVLTKPGPLTEAEYQLARRHAALGEQIIANISAFAAEAKLVRHHHENWDGSGYPDGLAGCDIPLGARIIHVADAVDDILMRRVYKPPATVERLLPELRRCAGSQFDPDLADAALRWVRQRPDQLVVTGFVA